MANLVVLEVGDRSDDVRALAVATNKRLVSREMAKMADEQVLLTRATLAAVRKAAWALGAQKATYEGILATGSIPIGVQQMIRNPGRRTPEQLARAKARIAHMRAERKRREEEFKKHHGAGGARGEIVRWALEAAQNYRLRPSAYHYLAGGIANTIFLEPTPPNYRSDCSQFAASVYKKAGLPSPANVAHELASTYTMVKCPRGRVVTGHPRPGDLGMYGSRDAPHHVEIYVGKPGAEFIGHGSPPIDSATPGLPSYYLTYDFLD